ncbi:MAG: DUF2272 domain-containing protein [Burkholderiaceae bacterium]
MANAALREHSVWGGQMMDAQGRLTQSGSSEAEDVPRPFLGLAPWERVLRYWHAVDPQEQRLPYIVRYGALVPADRAQLLAELAPAPLSWLDDWGGSREQELSPQTRRALSAALDRVAVVDTPWSAAFISWLAGEAGLGKDEFAFSEAHADYAANAWQATRREQVGLATSYALRACELTSTPPRVGDIACLARGRRSDLDTFAKLSAALEGRLADDRALPMHCDVVVRVDGEGFDAVGGNVLQSVTLRRLDFAAGTRLLDPSYQPGGCVAGAPGCVDRHMSRDPWTLLLQWR